MVGDQGVGKTYIQRQAAQAAKSLNFVIKPAIGDPTDIKGMPWIYRNGDDAIHAEFVAFGELQQVYDAIAQGLLCSLFIDDLGQASTAMQAGCMSLLDKLLGKCSVIAATNRRGNTGVSGILDPIKSRFGTITTVEANVEDFTEHLIDHAPDYDLDEDCALDLISFLRFRPDLLCQYKPNADLTNQPNPRTWISAGQQIMLRLPSRIEVAAIQGAVGEGPGGEFIAFRQIRKDMPNLDGIILDPAKAPIPEQLSLLWAVVTGLAAKVTEQNFARIAQYGDRLAKASHGEFGALLVRDCVQRNRRVANTPTFTKLAATDLGKLLLGRFA
jgi:hypothetical protein